MTAFLETRVNDLIESVSLQTVGGRQFSTAIVTTSAGFERRNINWSQSLGRWEFGDRVLIQQEIDDLIDFFESVAGKAVGFRFKDWSDFKCKSTAGRLIPTGVLRQYQLQKSYGSRTKKITKPVIVSLFENGAQFFDFVLDTKTGILTTATVRAGVLTWSGEFDLPARFDTDQLQTKFEAIDEESGDSMHYLYSLPVVELRV